MPNDSPTSSAHKRPGSLDPMRAQIRSFDWDDLGRDHPVDQTVNLVMHIGPLNSPGDETFQVTICTPQALDALLASDGIFIGRHHLIVNDLNTAKIEAFLQDRLRRLDGDTWQQLAEKIGRIGYWEFEDYSAATK